MRISPKTGFPGVCRKQTRIGGVGGGWGTELHYPLTQYSLCVKSLV